MMRLVVFLFGFWLFGSAAMAAQSSFDNWRNDFARRAIEKGFEATQVNTLLQDLTPDPEVLKRDGDQPEFTRTLAQYLEGVLSPARISQGRKVLQQNQALFDAISAYYHVPADVLAAVWGLESAYGRIQGNFDVVRSLATLAHDGRRKDWAEGELFAILKILKDGFAKRDDLKGAWAGAMGQTQFLPTSYLQYAVDWDRDGRKDIWNSKADALASTAYYLARHGWRGDEPWGIEVALPESFSFVLAEDTVLSIGSWSVRGVVRADHAVWSMVEQSRPAWLILPAGYKGPAFLVSKNFKVIKRYNNSTAYALGVGLLSEAIGERHGLYAAWPAQNGRLSRTQIKNMQTALGQMGYNAGRPDGMSGPNTRRALRAFQIANALVPDGYLDKAVFDKIMNASAHHTDTGIGEGQ
jgi:peptidoglycan lytic transglycosylase B